MPQLPVIADENPIFGSGGKMTPKTKAKKEGMVVVLWLLLCVLHSFGHFITFIPFLWSRHLS
jgi:hypothetical protein